jgi:hypothetical protein
MAKPPRTPRPEQALRKAFQAVEAKPVPSSLTDHLDRLTSPAKPRVKQ